MGLRERRATYLNPEPATTIHVRFYLGERAAQRSPGSINTDRVVQNKYPSYLALIAPYLVPSHLLIFEAFGALF